jgi:hypothetical protein
MVGGGEVNELTAVDETVAAAGFSSWRVVMREIRRKDAGLGDEF